MQDNYIFIDIKKAIFIDKNKKTKQNHNLCKSYSIKRLKVCINKLTNTSKTKLNTSAIHCFVFYKL